MPPSCEGRRGGRRPVCFPQEPAAGLSVFAPRSPQGRRGTVLGGRDRGRDVCGFGPANATVSFCGVTGAISEKSVVLPETAVGLRGAGAWPGAVGLGERAAGSCEAVGLGHGNAGLWSPVSWRYC